MTTPRKARAPRASKTTPATPTAPAAPAGQSTADILKTVEIIVPGQTPGEPLVDVNVSTTPGSTPPPVAVATPSIFSTRELSRLDTLAGEIVSLRQRAADLIERANMAALSVFNVATGEQPDGSRAADILAGIDKTVSGPIVDFPAQVLGYATKQRARAKLAAAQQEFESLRTMAGLADEQPPKESLAWMNQPRFGGDFPGDGARPDDKPGDNPHGLETNAHGVGPDTDPDAGPVKLPVADALPAAGSEDDCPED